MEAEQIKKPRILNARFSTECGILVLGVFESALKHLCFTYSIKINKFTVLPGFLLRTCLIELEGDDYKLRRVLEEIKKFEN